MIRGAEKRMIVVRTRDSRMFEEAYFVIRRDAVRTEADEPDMLWEANRILEGSLPCENTPIPRRPAIPYRYGLLRGLVWFGLGTLCGGGLTGLLWLLT